MNKGPSDASNSVSSTLPGVNACGRRNVGIAVLLQKKFHGTYTVVLSDELRTDEDFAGGG